MLCPKCKRPTLRHATNVSGWLDTPLYKCIEDDCGYVGRFFISIDPARLKKEVANTGSLQDDGCAGEDLTMDDRESRLEHEIGLVSSFFLDADHRNVISVSHNDGDGLAASTIIVKTMQFLKIGVGQVIFERSKSWKDFFKELLKGKHDVDAIILTDLGAEERQLCEIFSNKDIDLYLLDHHGIPDREKVENYPENVHSLNATRFGLNGLKEIAGSTLAYLFCERLTPRARGLAWVALVGMAGDTLENYRDYKSFNRFVLELAESEDQVSITRNAICLSGGMAEETIGAACFYSILPFIAKCGGDRDKCAFFLDRIGISPETKLDEIDDDLKEKLAGSLDEPIIGDVVRIRGKKGLLQFPFEFNFYISIVGDDRPEDALKIFDQKKLSRQQLGEYREYLGNIVENLSRIASEPAVLGETYRICELGPGCSKQQVSDIASFTSINGLLPREQALFIVKPEMDSDVKISVRCTPEFVESHGMGAGSIIAELSSKFGGRGGGHDLAGGWLISPLDYQAFLDNHTYIDEICRRNRA